MADEYDPTDCEMGICGPCERCQEELERQADEFSDAQDRSYQVSDPISEHADQMLKEAGTIDLTPSWVAVVRIYLEVIGDSSAGTNAREAARAEIMRAAALADLYVKEHKK